MGGWIATRAGGHYSTMMTHIDNLVHALTVITPQGEVRTFATPSSGGALPTTALLPLNLALTPLASWSLCPGVVVRQ